MYHSSALAAMALLFGDLALAAPIERSVGRDGLEVLSAKADGARKGRHPILFVHGVYHGAWAFEGNLMPYFTQRGFDTYALSLRGHGGSLGKERLRTAGFDDYLSDVRAAISRIGRPPILIGHSLGGMLARKELESSSLPAAVLISTPSPDSMKSAAMSLFLSYPWALTKFLVTGNPDHVYHDPENVRSLLFGGLKSPEADEAISRIVVQEESWQIFKDVQEVRFTPPRSPTHVLVIGGGRDPGVPRETFRKTAEHYGSSPPLLYEDMPHELMLAPGWERMAADILAWIEKKGLSP